MHHLVLVISEHQNVLVVFNGADCRFKYCFFLADESLETLQRSLDGRDGGLRRQPDESFPLKDLVVEPDGLDTHILLRNPLPVEQKNGGDDGSGHDHQVFRESVAQFNLELLNYVAFLFTAHVY